jgi:hypothetical protein
MNMNMLTKEEAKEIIAGLELKPIDSYVACVQRDYNKVMAKSRRSKRVVIEPVVEEIVVDEPVDETHEVVIIEAIE